MASSRLVAVAVSALMAGGVVWPDRPAAHTSPAASPTLWPRGGGCTRLEPTRVRLVSADGRTVPPTAPAAVKERAATELFYAMPGGLVASTIIPPAGFLPQDAEPATARAFGFDAPDDPLALAVWRARYRGMRRIIPSVPCLAHRSGSSAFSGRAAAVVQVR